MARRMAPHAVKPQASRLFRPNGASEAGTRNTPEPIELPTTKATHIQKPSKCGRAESFISDLYWRGR